MSTAQRAMSAPPEVVFNTATDPDRAAAWLPEPLRRGGPRMTDGLRASWTDGPDGWAAHLHVRPAGAGGAVASLRIDGDGTDEDLDGLAETTLHSLDREVADNLTAG